MPIAKITEAEVDAVVDLLPPSTYLKSYVNFGSRSTDCHKAYHLIAGLSALAQTCPIDYRLDFGAPVHANLYAICVGPSTKSRKSASIALTRSLLNDALPGSVGEEPGSRELLIDSLQQNPKQVVVYSEFGAFLSQSEKGYLNPLRTTYTDAYDCNPLGRATVRKKQNNVQAVAQFPRLSILAGSTLEYLERHTEPVDWTGGFLARFLVMYCDRERTNKIPPQKQPDRELHVTWLRNLTTFTQLGVKRGVCLGFDAEAKQFWEMWYDTLSAPTSSTISGAIERSYAQALKIALLLAWDFGTSRSADDWYIGLKELLPATRIVDLHVKSVMRIGESLAPSLDMRHRKIVLGTLEHGPRPLGEIIKEAQLTLRRTKELIETLMEEGTIHTHSVEGLSGQWFVLSTDEERQQRFHAGAALRYEATAQHNAALAQVIELYPQSASGTDGMGSVTTAGGQNRITSSTVSSGAGADATGSDTGGVLTY